LEREGRDLSGEVDVLTRGNSGWLAETVDLDVRTRRAAARILRGQLRGVVANVAQVNVVDARLGPAAEGDVLEVACRVAENFVAPQETRVRIEGQHEDRRRERVVMRPQDLGVAAARDQPGALVHLVRTVVRQPDQAAAGLGFLEERRRGGCTNAEQTGRQRYGQ